MTHVRLGNVEDGAAFENAGVVHQNLDIPGQCFPSISLACHVELFDREGDAARLRLALQGLDLCPDFNCGDDIESLLGQSHCSFVPESSSRARNQDLLHRDLLAWVNLVNTPQCMRHSRRRRPIRARNPGSLVSIRGVRDEMAASCCSNITRAMQEESAGLVGARASSTGSSSGVSFGKNNICEPRGLCAEWLRAFQALGAAEREV